MRDFQSVSFFSHTLVSTETGRGRKLGDGKLIVLSCLDSVADPHNDPGDPIGNPGDPIGNPGDPCDPVANPRDPRDPGLTWQTSFLKLRYVPYNSLTAPNTHPRISPFSLQSLHSVHHSTFRFVWYSSS